jgi:hypothetical protein
MAEFEVSDTTDMLSKLRIFADELSNESKEFVRALPEDALLSLHFSLGMEIRNAFFWKTSKAEMNLYAAQLYLELGKNDDGLHFVVEPDGMSHDAITYIWNYLSQKAAA